ncbi:hypothetical protein GT347_16180 [Xylophilus rhododendri]|uniref:Glycosyltransferase RgtA/B/C/D-like domain-containing protein n=1 Tax=Xylophilus rhododendri TaxID=2697032 RepID=A0A857J8I3_9BURK|nr:hypothetical protein [Xylophilus rhododendri]QHI99381.1 hypothetical protein GT347_16180 [Xylophilus rhododendri]
MPTYPSPKENSLKHIPSFQLTLKFLAVGMVVYWCLPLFSSEHREQFTAHLQAMAVLLAQQGSLNNYDPARALIGEFIFLTRPGTVDILAAANRLFDYGGNAAFRLLVGSSLAALMASASAFSARQGRIPFLTAVFACFLIPGLVEIGYFFNDNVVSAAFASLAVFSIFIANPSIAVVVAGGLAGMAILCRMDAVLAMPMLMLLFAQRPQRPTACALRLLLMVTVAGAIQLAAAPVNGAGFLDSLRISRLFTEKHMTDNWLRGALPLVFFLGAVAPPLLVLGAWTRWKEKPAGLRGWIWATAFYFYPLLVVAITLRVATDSRYFMPLLAPVLALHTGTGIQTVLSWLRGSDLRRRRLAIACIGLAAVVLAAPPALSSMRDGPRVMIGRLWDSMFYLRWQDATRQDLQTARALATDAERHRVATVVTTHFNDDYYLRLRLIEDGYREAPVIPSCRPLSLYRRGSQEIWHVRMYPSYFVPPFPHEVAAALPLLGAGRCAPLLASQAFWLSTVGHVPGESRLNGIVDADFAGAPVIGLGQVADDMLRRTAEPKLHYEVMRTTQVNLQRIDSLTAGATRSLSAYAARSGDNVDAMLDRYEDSFRPR